MFIWINSDLEACNDGDNILHPVGAFVHTKLSAMYEQGTEI